MLSFGSGYDKIAICSTNRNAAMDIMTLNVIGITYGERLDISRQMARISIGDLIDEVTNGKVIGVRINNNGEIETIGKLEDYPYINFKGELKNNLPVIVDNQEDHIVIVNGLGRPVKIKKELAIQRFDKFANAIKNKDSIVMMNMVANNGIRKSKLMERILNFNSDIKPGDKEALSNRKEILEKIVVNNLDESDIASQFTEQHSKNDQSKTASVANTNENKSTWRQSRNIEFDGDKGYAFDIVEVDDRVELRSYNGQGFKGTVIIPDGVTHICNKAFALAEASILIMPDSVEYLGDESFLESEFSEINLSKNVTAIPYLCFGYTGSLKKINLENIKSLDNLAFLGSGIEEVNISAPLIQIGVEAFKNCRALKVFNHAGTLKKIRNHAFENCISLSDFDFSSVLTIEQQAFCNTGLKKVVLNGDVNYLQNGTITGEIQEIEFLDGFYKIAANSVSNKQNNAITWRIPKSVTNIESGTFKSQDTVYCYSDSVAYTMAELSDANIVCLDDKDASSIPGVIRKAKLLDASIEDILKNTLKSVLSNDTVEEQYVYVEDPVRKGDMPDLVFDVIGNSHKYGGYATDDDIANEKPKFKCILDYLHRVAYCDIFPFSSNVLSLRDTFNTGNYYDGERLEKSKTDVLYSDGISEVLRIRYIDNKFESINGSFIVAKTKDTLRYICMDNKYTNIMCENRDTYDVSQLLNILRPGDTIGLNNVIQGVKYPEIVELSNKKVTTSSGGRKFQVRVKMNMYQALRYSSITIKLDNNAIALIIPRNRTVIKCASLGKTVWQNEKEETYKSLQCTIESIEDIDNNTVFDYKSTYGHLNYGSIFKRFKEIAGNNEDYVSSYSKIHRAERSMYKHAGDYALKNGITDISSANLKFMLGLFKTSLFEERKGDWLEGSIGKTIVADVKSSFELADGVTINQYRSVKRIALRNKLMSGGDRKLYIFEIVDKYNLRLGVYISLYDIETLAEMCIGINNHNGEDIFKNKSKFDLVSMDNVIQISTLCRDNTINIKQISCSFILAVYKPNGLYYIGLKIHYAKEKEKFIPIIQVGELNVALEFVEETNKHGISNNSMYYLYKGALGILAHLVEQAFKIKYSEQKYLGLLKSRELCILGVADIQSYNKLGLPEVLKRCLGYSGDLQVVEDESIKNGDYSEVNDEYDSDEYVFNITEDDI